MLGSAGARLAAVTTAASKLASVSPGPMRRRRRCPSWQWEGYPQFHRDRANLAIHLVAVPSFIASAVLLAACLATMHWVVAGVSVLTLAVAFFVQGIGHGREVTPAIPFADLTDAVTRILAEQFITFPRFVIRGAWRAAFRNAVPRRLSHQR
jgi:uncharacterized membrane protein YGL010W